MNRLGDFYQWFWFHSEWYLTPVNRRPYTFIFRDWIYTHLPLSVPLFFAWFIGLAVLSVWHGTTATILAIFTGLLAAHLVWGTKWIEHEQEFPEYTGGNR